MSNDPGYPGWVSAFHKLHPKDGKISGGVAKKDMLKSRLPNPTLSK